MQSEASPSSQQQAMDAEEAKLAQANKLFQAGVLMLNSKRKNIDKAIKCIQRAITFNDSDYRYWQFLGEAYYQRGSLNPAINCFMKSLLFVEKKTGEEDDKRRQADCTYSKLRMSDIRLSVGHLDDALKGYQDIIHIEQENVAALVGLAKTRLQLARNAFSSGLVKLGHQNCMEALRHSLKAIKLRPHLCLTWKLGADCCLVQFLYGQRGHFQAEIDEEFPGAEGDKLYINRRTCLELAQQFICKALSIEPFQESGCIWHNLGISLYLKSTLSQNVSERKELLTRSMKCLLTALDFDRASSQIKNSIGVVAYNLNLLNTAQNFLIKSIQTNMSTSETQFSNLGFIYLQKGEYRLANVAFSRGQAEEPLYSRSWLGSALLNEQSNLDNLAYLRHCNRLENHYESQLLFATKVTTLPLNEEHQKDILNALDCMKRIINYNPQSLEANNTLGLLCEKSNYKNEARHYFETAYELCHQDSRVIFNRLRRLTVSPSCVSGQATCDSSKETEFLKCADKLTNSGNREYILNFIYYLFNNQDYHLVNTKMTKFLDKLPQSDIKSKVGAQILLGLASKAQDRDYKSWFFKNIIDLENVNCEETIVNLQCLLLLGAISKDAQLVEQISQDLSRRLSNYISSQDRHFLKLFNSPNGFWIKTSIFSSIICNPPNSGIKLIRSILAMFPTMPELWVFMGLALLFQKGQQAMAAFCIRKASLIGSTLADLGVVCDILLAILTRFDIASLESRTKYLSRALYKFPDINILWKSLETSTSKSQVPTNLQLSDEDSSLFHIAIDVMIRIMP